MQETYSAFFVVADSAVAAPASFLAAAERWRDRHIFAAVPSLQAALPASIAVPVGAAAAVFSNVAQQWAGAGEAAPAAHFYQGSHVSLGCVIRSGAVLYPTPIHAKSHRVYLLNTPLNARDKPLCPA